jgi:branched-chain amino acid transport system substrate-binding protein
MTKKGITTTIAVLLAIVMLVVGLLIGLLASPYIFPTAGQTSGLTGDIQLGAILSLTGDLATFGENEQVAAEFAARKVNELLVQANANWSLVIVPEDTQTNPDLALEKVESLAARGIKLIIGPLSSGEVRAIKGYCDSNKILAISQSSTAPDMAIQDDYIFRFCPTDKGGQGPAIGRIMYDDGKRYIIPVARNDAWGIGLRDATKTKFEALNGTFLEGIEYDPEAADFTAEASDLGAKVAAAIETYGAEEVAVLHISFEEASSFMTACLGYAALQSVKWYGSDGTATSGALLEDEDVRDFAMTVGYPSTIFSPTQSAKWEMVRQEGIAKLGREPESYSYAIYDIVWAYALSLMAVNTYDAEAIKNVLPTITETMFGASGWIQLDEAGDRKAGDYDIWQMKEKYAGAYDWEVVGTYILASDSVEWK